MGDDVGERDVLALAGSAVLHVGYNAFLAEAYAHADLSQAYPLARGSAPLIVAAVSAAAGVRIAPGEWLAMGAISAGILVMALMFADGRVFSAVLAIMLLVMTGVYALQVTGVLPAVPSRSPPTRWSS